MFLAKPAGWRFLSLFSNAHNSYPTFDKTFRLAFLFSNAHNSYPTFDKTCRLAFLFSNALQLFF